jgi:hypothetical protein
VLAVVSAAQFLAILDLWVVNIALPALQRDFAPASLADVSRVLAMRTPSCWLRYCCLPGGPPTASAMGTREFGRENDATRGRSADL